MVAGTSRSSMQSFLCWTWWEFHHNTCEASAGLWIWCNVKSTRRSLGQNVFWRQNRCWRWAVQWKVIYNKDRANTVPVREPVRSDRRWAVKMIADELKWSGKPFVWYWQTKWFWGQRNLCQDGSEESHTATARCANQCWCWSTGTSGSWPKS